MPSTCTAHPVHCLNPEQAACFGAHSEDLAKQGAVALATVCSEALVRDIHLVHIHKSLVLRPRERRCLSGVSAGLDCSRHGER